ADKIRYPCYRGFLARNKHPPFGRAHQVFVSRNGEPSRNTRFLVDILTLTRLKRNLLNQVLQQAINLNSRPLFGREPGLLESDFTRYINAFRVMGQYLAFDAVFKWRDDRSAIGIILRVGGKYKLDVERQPQPEPANLDIFLLQHIEQGNLDTGLEVGELVNHENTAVCPWDQSEVDDPFVVVGQFKRSRFNRVDIPYEVRHGHVWSSQFFCIP